MQPSATSSDQHLIISEGNNSARMEIENLFLEHFVEQENTENVAPVIRHQEHRLAKLKNASLHEFSGRNATKNDFSTSFLCYLSGGSTGLLSTASILSILLIAIDQYFAVTHPLRYHAFIDKFKSIILLVSTWLISLLFGILGAFVQTDTRVWSFCGVTQDDKNSMQNWYNIFYAFTYFILVILVPFAVICVIYGCIYCAAHRNSERMRKSNSGSSNTNLDVYIQIPLDDCRLKVKVNSSDNVTHIDEELPKLPKVKSAPNFANFERTKFNMPMTRLSGGDEDCVKVSHANSLRSNASFINSLRTKISNASLFKYREETRAAKISILVIFMVLVCYVPYGLALVMNTNLIFPSPRYFNSVSLSLLVSANLMSPFLFAYRNRRIQRELRRLFGLLPKRSGRELSIFGPSAFRCNSSRNRTERTSCVYKPKEIKELAAKEPFLPDSVIPEVVVTCKTETEKKSILKRVCSKGKTWGTAKRCNFMSVTECLSVECRCSFSSASTQVSSEDYSVCN